MPIANHDIRKCKEKASCLSFFLAFFLMHGRSSLLKNKNMIIPKGVSEPSKSVFQGICHGFSTLQSTKAMISLGQPTHSLAWDYP